MLDFRFWNMENQDFGYLYFYTCLVNKFLRGYLQARIKFKKGVFIHVFIAQ